MNLNKAFLIGRLTRDPENKALASGQSLTSFGLATDRFFTDKNGQKQQQTEFHNIVLFGKLADIAAQYLYKGSLVLIEGRLQTRSWQDSSGNKRSRTEIIAERLQLGPKSAGKTASAQEPAQEPEKETQGEEDKSSSSSFAATREPKEDIPVIEEDGEIDISKIPF